MPFPLSLRLSFVFGLIALAACLSARADSPLAFAPADTPYAFATDGVSPEIADAWIERDEALPALYLPILERLLAQPASETADPADAKRGRALLKALQSELKGHGLAALFERWGLARSPRAAVFGMGLRPVARIELADPARFEGRLVALLRRAGIDHAASELESVRYWRLGARAEAPTFLLGLHEGQLVLTIAVTSEAGEEPDLRSVFGLQRPTHTLLDSGDLPALNARLGFVHGGSGFVDSRRLMAEMMKQAPEPTSEDSARCRARAETLLADWPRLAVGVAELSPDHYRVRYVLETSPELLPRLASLQAPSPGPGPQLPAPLELAVGFQPQALRSLLTDPGPALRGDCLGEVQLALWFSRLSTALSDPRLLAVSEKLSGLRLRLDELRTPMEPDGPSLRGSIVGLARSQEALDQLISEAPKDLTLPETGGPAVPLSAAAGQPEWMQLFMARSDTSLGLAFGEDSAAALPAELKAPTQAQPALIELSLSGPYWAAKLRELAANDRDSSAMFGPTLHGLEQAKHTRMRLAATEFGLELETEVRYR
jgi:hypothetical protein